LSTEPVLEQGKISSWLSKQGIVPSIKWGYLAVLVFMVGDGIELGFLAVFLEDRGFTGTNVATLISVYGVVVAAAAWLSGALSEAWGPRKVMLYGFGIWAVFEVIFLLAIVAETFPIMLLAYGIRGFGYPFFAYGFLVWVTMVTPKPVIGRAVGWYWFFNVAGIGVVSAYFAGIVIPMVGQFATMWLSLMFVVAGGLIAIFLLKDPQTGRTEKMSPADNLKSMARGLTIVKTHPKIGIGGIVRLINTASFYAFPVFLSTHMVNEVGFSLTQWQTIWGTLMFANILGNIISGYLGDKIGHVNVIAWIGGLGCAIMILAFYYIPYFYGANFLLTMVVAGLLGLGIAAYCPLSAVVPLLAPKHAAAAVAILNLGAGLSNAAGPLLVRGFGGVLDTEGLMIMFAGLHGVGVLLTFLLRDETNPERAHDSEAFAIKGTDDELGKERTTVAATKEAPSSKEQTGYA